jgi:hypothetical protein
MRDTETCGNGHEMACTGAYTLDWAPDPGDPDDSTASVHDLRSTESLRLDLYELQDYVVYWTAHNERSKKLTKLPLSSMELAFVGSYGNQIYHVPSRYGGWVVGTKEMSQRLLDALPACMEIIRKDKQWRP